MADRQHRGPHAMRGALFAGYPSTRRVGYCGRKSDGAVIRCASSKGQVLPCGKGASIEATFSDLPCLGYPRPCLRRAFPKPWTVEPMPSGYRVLDANGIVLANGYG